VVAAPRQSKDITPNRSQHGDGRGYAMAKAIGSVVSWNRAAKRHDQRP
jgi:hypothetical protein